MTTAAPSILGRSLRLGVFFSSIYHIFFTLVFRRPIYNVLSGIAMLFFEISTTDPVVRVGFFDFRNFLDLTLSTVFIILLWETMSTAIETTYSMPLDLDNDPSRVSLLLLTLKNSSKSSSYEQMLAFMDLLRLATCSNPRSREQLFNGTGAFESSSISNSSSSTNSSITVGDASKTGTSSAEWIEIAAACLDRINKLQKTLVEIQEQNANSDGNNRKNEKGGASVLKRSSSSGITSLKLQGAAAAAAVGSATPSPIKKMKLLTGAVKPSPVKRDVVGSFLDALQEDGAINVDKTGIQVGGPNGLYKVGGGGSKKDITGRGWIDGLVGGFSSGSKGDKKNAIGKRGMRKLTSDAFEDYQIIALAIQSVAKLLIAGTKEDKYGSVQRDIPVVLESLINCLVAVETHIAKPAGPLEGGNQYGSIVLREPLAMIHVLQTNVYFITTNLGDHLARYKFEPNVANKLKRFIDYLE
ncbi:hypothetical protein BDR26DRAFT_863000 [Obelidium mucronatum]|nr:hypothetical protein BDR26DRAFT_863000 [Obelidium mucronatum]